MEGLVSVYVDNYKGRLGRMTMCHMIADSTEELLVMAFLIGIKHKWLQHAGEPDEHFDICLSKRKAAVANGAIEITAREGVAKIIARRHASVASPT